MLRRPPLLPAAAALLGLALAAPGAARAVDLVGSWYVLVHYKDEATPHPERERWEDRLWVFEREGDRLRWTDYPIVVFDDATGRFEQLGTNRQARVLHFWEPNEGQRAEIAGGLEYNPRGSRNKTLRETEEGWSSATPGAGYSSARFITYTETWTIAHPDEAPRFAWDASMGSPTSENFEGRTLFETTEVREDGALLIGRYERDGTRHGTFRAVRTEAADKVKTRLTSEGEGAYRLLFGEMGKQLYRGEVPGAGDEEALRAQIREGGLSEDERREVRLGFEEFVANAYRAQGNEDLTRLRPQIQSLARKMTVLFVDEGKSVEEIRAMLEDGRLRP